MRAYLSGAIEHAPAWGTGWRDEMEDFLRTRLGHTAYNPAREIPRLLTAEEWSRFREWKETDFPRFQEIMRRIIRHDLDELVNRSDYVICCWDQFCAKGGGTHGELTMAFWSGIPVFLVTELPVAGISSWITGCCHRLFHDFPALRCHLEETREIGTPITR